MTERQHGSERVNVQFAQIPGVQCGTLPQQQRVRTKTKNRDPDLYDKKQKTEFIFKLPQLEDWRIAWTLVEFMYVVFTRMPGEREFTVGDSGLRCLLVLRVYER